MAFNNLLLTVDTIAKLEIIDEDNVHYSMREFTDEKLITTKSGQRLICIYPLSEDWENASATHIITIKNPDETRTEIHQVLTLKDVKNIVGENLGLTLLYESNMI